jgi:Tfp pilus assembly protein PilO
MALGDYLKAERLVKLPWYQKALILGVGVLIIVIVYFTTLDRSYKAKISELRGNVAKLDKQITDLKTVERDLPKFERQNALLKKQLEKAMTKLPSKTQIDALLKDITVRANDNAIDIVSLSARQIRPGIFMWKCRLI